MKQAMCMFLMKTFIRPHSIVEGQAYADSSPETHTVLSLNYNLAGFLLLHPIQIT